MLDENSDVYVAKTLSLMNYLTGLGYYCFKVRDDEKNPEFKIFYFRRTKELERLADEFIAKKKEKKERKEKTQQESVKESRVYGEEYRGTSIPSRSTGLQDYQ